MWIRLQCGSENYRIEAVVSKLHRLDKNGVVLKSEYIGIFKKIIKNYLEIKKYKKLIIINYKY